MTYSSGDGSWRGAGPGRPCSRGFEAGDQALGVEFGAAAPDGCAARRSPERADRVAVPLLVSLLAAWDDAPHTPPLPAGRTGCRDRLHRPGPCRGVLDRGARLCPGGTGPGPIPRLVSRRRPGRGDLAATGAG